MAEITKRVIKRKKKPASKKYRTRKVILIEKLANPVGAPPKMTPETLERLRQAFLIGATDEEACGYADIGKSTLYNYQNEHPEFLEKKEAWKNEPILTAKNTIINNLKNPIHAEWYLARKKKDEFSERHENTGKNGKDLIPRFVVQTNESKEQLEKLYEESKEDAGPSSTDD